MSGMFEAGVALPLTAVHRLPWAEGPEAEPHAHEYRLEVTVERAGTDGRGMVVDLDVLQAALQAVVGRLQGQDLDRVIAPQDAEAVTVELLARWIYDELAPTLRTVGADVLAVRVWESAHAFGGYRGAISA
jgi:6-pyruvoyl-tetrahydropterin synthase